MKIIHKNNESEFDDGLNCVLSDTSVDRYGDIVGDISDPMLGWDVSDFRRNPIALFNHQSSFPIGTWKDIHVEDRALRGRLQMAPSGTSSRIDELKSLLSAGVLKGISVGFIPVEHKILDNKGGYHYLRQKLIEASLVSVPANPAALLTAKAMGVSRQTIDMVFKQGQSLAQRIREYRRSIRGFKDRIAKAPNPKSRASLARALKHLEQGERELVASLDPRTRNADRRRALEEAQDREVDRLVAEYEASWAGQIARQHDEMIAGYTAQALKHRDPPKTPHDPNSAPYGTWRGVKLPGPTWRGKKV
jgi:HK97 family phage prohead protease